MKIYLVVWDGDTGTSVEYYWTDEARNAAIHAELASGWDKNDGPLPDDWQDIWEKVSDWADYWLHTEEIDTDATDHSGALARDLAA